MPDEGALDILDPGKEEQKSGPPSRVKGARAQERPPCLLPRALTLLTPSKEDITVPATLFQFLLKIK